MRRLTNFFYGTILLLIITVGSITTASPAAPNSAARFGYYWMDNTLPYDSEFSYFFDVGVYPDGVFVDGAEHSWAYITAQNKHIIYDGVPYSVEVVLQYGYGVNNSDSIKRVWMNDFDDPSRFTSWWIDSDADGEDFWELSTLDVNGYLNKEQDMQGDVLNFLRVQAQTILVSETAIPNETTWENRFFFYNFNANQWELKAKNSFTIPADRQAVRDSTFVTGSGIWSAILETEDDGSGLPDNGTPPVKKIVYKNRWIKTVDQGIKSTVNLDESNNWWIEPQSPYQLFYRSQPVYSEFAAGTVATTIPFIEFLQIVIKPVTQSPIVFADSFNADTTPNYERIGVVSWQASGKNVLLGSTTPSESKLYKNLGFGSPSVVLGRLYIPSTGVGTHDSVALALKGEGIEYWATIAYGSNLIERNNISILRNDVWGDLYPISIDPGWYTVKLLVDYHSGVLQMKAWVDGANEPEWQVSRPLDTNWVSQGFGFRHFGQGALVDDLMLIINKQP